VTRIFKQLAPRGYKSARSKPFGRRLEPELAVSLADLGLTPIAQS